MSKKSHAKHEKKQHKKHVANTKPGHLEEEDIFTEHRFSSEILIGILIFSMGLFFMVPVATVASAPVQLGILAIFMLTILVFVVVHWRKLKHQKAHPQMPLVERFIYLSTVSILSVAILVQVLSGELDLWLPAILVIIVLLKVLLSSRLASKQ